MVKNYVWTKRAESHWNYIKSIRKDIPENEHRKEGTPATFAYNPIGEHGSIAKAWLEAGFIKELE